MYDYLLKSILNNVVLFIIYLAVVLILWKSGKYLEIIITSAVLWVVLWHLLTPAVMYYWQKVIRGTEHRGMLPEIFTGLKTFSLRGLVVLAINALVGAVAFVGMNFYRSHMGSKVLVIIGGLAIWIIFCFILMQIYLFPIMVMDEKKRIFTSYKKSVIMFLSAPFSSAAILIFTGFLLVLFYPLIMGFAGPHASGVFVYVSLFPIFLLPFFSIIFIIFMQLNAAIILFEKHNIYPDLKSVWEEKSWSDLFRPWEVK